MKFQITMQIDLKNEKNTIVLEGEDIDEALLALGKWARFVVPHFETKPS